MAKVTKNPLLPPLRPDDLGGKDSAVATVETVLVDVPTKQNRRGKATILVLKEYPGKGLYLNATSIENALQGFGSDESNNWKGKKVPLIVVESDDPRAADDPDLPRTTKRIWIAPADKWSTMLRR